MFDLDLIGTPAFALAVVDGEFRYIGMNARLQAATGLDIGVLRGETPYACFPKATADLIVSRYSQCVLRREALEYEELYDLPGGRCWWAVSVTPVIDQPSGRVSALLGIAVDITRRRNAELANEEANARLALAMDVVEGGFWHLDVAAEEFRTSLPLAALVAGAGSPELGLEDYLSYIEPEDLPAADLSSLIAGRQDESVAEYRMRTYAGETRWIRCKRRLVRDGNNRPHRIVGVATDVTEQKALQARYKKQATTDMLTGLANRRSLEARAQERIVEARKTGRRFGLLMLDLDRFKPVNDDYGHAAGDAVLREVAARLTAAMRDQDLVARFGGDEFAILVDDVEPASLTDLAKGIVRVIAKPFSVDGRVVSIGTSVGAAVFEPADATFDGIALRADRALYAMKHARRAGYRPAA